MQNCPYYAVVLYKKCLHLLCSAFYANVSLLFSALCATGGFIVTLLSLCCHVFQFGRGAGSGGKCEAGQQGQGAGAAGAGGEGMGRGEGRGSTERGQGARASRGMAQAHALRSWLLA